MFKKLKLRSKLLVVLLIPIIALVLSLLSSVNILQTVSRSYVRSLYDECYQSSVLILNADRDLYQALHAFYQLVFEQSAAGEEIVSAMINENLQEAEERITLAQTALEESWGEINTLRHPASGRTVADNFQVFFTSFTTWQRAVYSLTELWQLHRLSPDLHELTSIEQEFASAREALNQLGELLEMYAKNNIEKRQTEINNYQLKIFSFNSLMLFLSLFVGLIIIRDIASYMLKDIRAPLRIIAQGDLRTKFDTERQDELGEIAQELNKTAGQIAGILGGIRQSSAEVNTAAREIATANNDLAERTHEEAAALEEISATIEEMNASIQQINNNAGQANEFSQTTLSAVQNGEAYFKETFDTMKAIADSNKQIAEIIKVVDDIAFQTNLLALNAAVEAARAGTHGKGFAVVADEVRNLAQKAAEAATEIGDLIVASVQRTEQGNKLVQNSSQLLEKIVTNTKRTSEFFQQVTHTVEEQAYATEQIKLSIDQINEVTQQNAAMVEEISSTSELLSNKAQELYQLVNRFKIATAQRA